MSLFTLGCRRRQVTFRRTLALDDTGIVDSAACARAGGQ
jgi:hypothetical protein